MSARAPDPGDVRSVDVVLTRATEPATPPRPGPGAGLRGRLLGPDHAGLAGWTVIAIDEQWQPSDRTPSPETGEAPSDDDGAFAITGLHARSCRVVAVPRACERALGTVPLADGIAPGPEPHTFVVAATSLPTASVRGIVLGPDRSALAGIVAMLRNLDAERAGRGSAREAKADGTFAFGPLLPGRYELELQAEAFAALPRRMLRLAPDDQVDLGSIQFETGTRITVRVLDAAGAPWPHKLPELQVQRDAGDGTWERVRGSFNVVAGELRSPPLPAGTVRIAVVDGRLFAWPLDVDAVDGHDTRVELRVANGVLRQFLFELPPDAHTVRVEARRAGTEGRVRRIATDVKGKILIALALLPGAWSVTGEDDRGNRYRATVDLAATDADAPGTAEAPWVVMQR